MQLRHCKRHLNLLSIKHPTKERDEFRNIILYEDPKANKYRIDVEKRETESRKERLSMDIEEKAEQKWRKWKTVRMLLSNN